MPPKRKATLGAADPNVQPAGRQKKAKTTADAAASSSSKAKPAAPSVPPRSLRWSAGISGSANIDAAYKLTMRDPAIAHKWICTCPISDDDDEEDWDEEDEEELADDEAGAAEKAKSRCDGGRTCVCSKPAAEHPAHEWVFTAAALRKQRDLCAHTKLRDPDCFAMYTYNDHSGYGVLEVMQNIILDFDEARHDKNDKGWQAQWAVVEAAALFMLTGFAEPMFMVDDSDMVAETMATVGKMVLTMLSTLKEEGLLTPDSEVRNVGLVMALYLKLGAQLRSQSIFDSPTQAPKKSKTFRFDPQRFDDYIYAYAREAKVPFKGVAEVEEYTAELKSDVAMPAEGAKDPWKFAAALKGVAGGDKLDITTWSSADRKSHNFDKKDPLSKKELDALKKGMILAAG